MLDKYTSFHEPRSARTIYGDTGILERGYILLPPASWVALKRLGAASSRTGSQVIEALITLTTQAQGGRK